MAESGQKAEKQPMGKVECPICMIPITDSTMPPCIYTCCVQCLNQTEEAAHNKPGEKMPCPLCHKEFIITEDEINGVQKNLFVANLLGFKGAMQMLGVTKICDMCNTRNEDNRENLPTATTEYLKYHDHHCESCVKGRPFQKVTKDHQAEDIRNDMKSDRRRLVSLKCCAKHINKPLDYYCSDCKKIVCVSCFVESHKLHDCKDVTTVDEEFLETIEEKVREISAYVNEILLMRHNNEKIKTDFLIEVVDKEKEILKRNQELKDITDRHTKLLLDELSVIKLNHLEQIENEMENIDQHYTTLQSFEDHCTELKLKGSASDICSSFDELISRAQELEKEHEAFICRPHQSVKLSFQSPGLEDILQNSNSNFVGKLEASKTEITTQFENVAVILGLQLKNDGATISNDVVEINLHHSNVITRQQVIPTKMVPAAVAAVYSNTMYVAGLGDAYDEIWKYKRSFGWKQCASLVQGRRKHSAAFIDEVLYICGGFVNSTELILDSVEAFSTVTNKCTTVGNLDHSVFGIGICVPYRSSLYIFGGLDKDGESVNHIQLYNVKENKCTLISRPITRKLQSIIWKTYIISLGCDTCFVFNVDSETWEERKQFKTDFDYFGLVLENGRLFVIGGEIWDSQAQTSICSDDVRYVPFQNIIDNKPVDWEFYGKLPKPCLVQTCAKLRK